MSSLDPLRTPRLIGRPLGEQYWDDLLAMSLDPVGMESLGGVWTEEETRTRLTDEIAHWDEHGFGLWAFTLRDDVPPEELLAATSPFVGRAGLRRAEFDGQDEIDLRYALRPEHWGQGYGTEIACALCEVAFGVLGLRDLVAIAMPTNRASRRVMEKAGFRYEKDIVHKDLPHVLYRKRRPAPGSRDARSAEQAA